MWQQINSKEISQLPLILKHIGIMKLLKKKKKISSGDEFTTASGYQTERTSLISSSRDYQGHTTALFTIPQTTSFPSAQHSQEFILSSWNQLIGGI